MLRRYRGNYLDERWYGRLLIKFYYLISSTIVMLFGKTEVFNRIRRRFLDNRIQFLRERDCLDTPYRDKH